MSVLKVCELLLEVQARQRELDGMRLVAMRDPASVTVQMREYLRASTLTNEALGVTLRGLLRSAPAANETYLPTAPTAA
jgi:hypothetical protein